MSNLHEIKKEEASPEEQEVMSVMNDLHALITKIKDNPVPYKTFQEVFWKANGRTEDVWMILTKMNKE